MKYALITRNVSRGGCVQVEKGNVTAAGPTSATVLWHRRLSLKFDLCTSITTWLSTYFEQVLVSCKICRMDLRLRILVHSAEWPAVLHTVARCHWIALVQSALLLALHCSPLLLPSFVTPTSPSTASWHALIPCRTSFQTPSTFKQVPNKFPFSLISATRDIGISETFSLPLTKTDMLRNIWSGPRHNKYPGPPVDLGVGVSCYSLSEPAGLPRECKEPSSLPTFLKALCICIAVSSVERK